MPLGMPVDTYADISDIDAWYAGTHTANHCSVATRYKVLSEIRTGHSTKPVSARSSNDCCSLKISHIFPSSVCLDMTVLAAFTTLWRFLHA